MQSLNSVTKRLEQWQLGFQWKTFWIPSKLETFNNNNEQRGGLNNFFFQFYNSTNLRRFSANFGNYIQIVEGWFYNSDDICHFHLRAAVGLQVLLGTLPAAEHQQNWFLFLFDNIVITCFWGIVMIKSYFFVCLAMFKNWRIQNGPRRMIVCLEK